MNIAGKNISLIPSGWSLQGAMTAIIWSLLIFLVIAGVAWWLYRGYRNKTFYATPVTLTQRMDNGTKKTRFGLLGGKFINKAGIWDFRVKIPGQFKTKELGYMPDFSKADADGTVHFLTSGDGVVWQQLEQEIAHKGTAEIKNEDGTIQSIEYSLISKPVRTDVKNLTVASIIGWKGMIMQNKDKLIAIAIGFGFFFITVIAHLVSLYIQTKIKCGG